MVRRRGIGLLPLSATWACCHRRARGEPIVSNAPPQLAPASSRRPTHHERRQRAAAPVAEWTTGQYEAACAALEAQIAVAPVVEAGKLQRFLDELRRAWGRAGVEHGRSPRAKAT